MKWFDLSSVSRMSGEYEDKLSKAEGVVKFTNVDVQPDAENTEKEEDGFSLSFTVSTTHVDRDGDTIDQEGWDLREYQKNPIILWVHDATSPPVAKASNIHIDPISKSLRSTAVFPSKDLYPFGNMVGRLYLNGFMRGASVGFMPLEYEINKERDGFSPTDFKRQKLLEWSAVPVPSNPEGLAEARSAGIDVAPVVEWAEKILDNEGCLVLPRETVERCWKYGKEYAMFSVQSKDPDETKAEEPQLFSGEEEDTDASEENVSTEVETEADAPADLGETLDQILEGDGGIEGEDGESEQSEDEVKTKGAISYNAAHPDGTPKAPEGEAWSGPRQVAAADVQKLFHMCAWYDTADKENKGAYKLPHHEADGNTLVWRGVAAAMAALMGARGGVDMPSGQRRGVYNHLAKHYRDFDKEPPPFNERSAKTSGDLADEVLYEETNPCTDVQKDISKVIVDTEEKCSQTAMNREEAKEVVKTAVTEEIKTLRSLICQLSGKQGVRR